MSQTEPKPAMETSASPLDFASSPINKSLSSEDKIEHYRQMLRIRRFENASAKNYSKGNIGGFLHLYIGQESLAVGAASLMGANDHMITAYRCHAHALAVGMNMNECMAELYGKATGCSKGKGGSMHFFAPDKNFWGGHGIVAGQTPLGLGLGYGLKYKGLEGSALCFLGDGAVNQGAFHESLNIAALFGIPVVYIIENNGYSMGTSQKRSSAFKDCLAQRADGYEMDWDVVNGEDFYEVRAKVNIAMERARKESKPTVLEINTYRYYGHSVADANHKKYRSPEEIEKYKKDHDPINLWKQRLLDEGLLTEESAKVIDTEAKQEAAAATTFAEDSPAPTIESITEDVYWEVDNNTEASKIGRHFFND
ncbi:pyruvate dehydrogenase (acetyl-transferring) E1 component subunit alpha [Akkermansiaceae bacterium]|nr:pyruvate dehydrogenase (acetyl-transferring) E1 component subunit alpha [Akkermansiaceae bacterium]MDB4288634.1 pyruvate dehydrogenase (acetyl-transferring) E1 component subunit alpha [bacterium]MDA7517741.1 pyruvate dehydrogenase (acetyl-transferring) E1 component subunit alpha [Akkermansiaceae bacterium]MDA7538599.1 pyruvate dehydrogenase (acetyl-transferring) E1 component subunit alpha [Akkermansiaceae bacterium]MDA7649127.1 pyruvate dehydrogenase (acetyl-transferring) E1 component subuni